MEKTMKARIQHKHDIEANWLKATIFTPLASEIIVYDPDENYDYPRIKIGDGKTNINALPFVTKDYAKISDIPTKPEDIGALPDSTVIPTVPTKISAFENDKGYLTQHQSLDAYAKTADLGALATKDSLTASEVGALPSTTKIPGALSDLSEDTTHRVVTDAEKEAWSAKSNFSGSYNDLTNKPAIPSVAGLASTTYVDDAVKNKVDKDGNKVLSTNDYTTAEKNKLANIAAGAEVNVNADWNATSGDAQILNKPILVSAFTNDAGYLTEHQSLAGLATESYVNSQIAAIPTPDVSGQINNHNIATDTHNDIRLLINGLTTRLNTLANSDDTTLDQMSEVVAYIKNNKSLIEGVTNNKVNVSDIINNLTTNVSNKPLSAAQGVALKALIDAIVVPTKVSELVNDKNYLTSYTETDPTVPAWAKASTKPTYTAEEVGADTSGTASNLVSVHNTTSNTHSDIREQISQLSTDKADKSAMTLGVHTDGFVYLFINGVPQGNGLDIKADVVEGDVFGYVDENNVIVLNGALAEGTYTIKYEMDDGSTVEIGNLVLDNNVYYSITNNLTNCTNSNNTVQMAEGGSYSATITAKSGYELSSVKVTMGGTDISSSVVSGGTITIASVSGNIVVTAVAEVAAVKVINQLPISTDASGNPFVGTNGEAGYKTGFRLSISSGNESAATGLEVTGYIPVKLYDTVYLRDITVSSADTKQTVVYYDADYNVLGGCYTGGAWGDTNGEVVSVQLKSSAFNNAMTNDVAFIRITAGEITADSVITVNQEITADTVVS